MSLQRTEYRSWDEEKAHREARIKKLERVQGLEQLLAEWEERAPETDEDRDYIRELKDRLRQARNQYLAMKE